PSSVAALSSASPDAGAGGIEAASLPELAGDHPIGLHAVAEASEAGPPASEPVDSIAEADALETPLARRGEPAVGPDQGLPIPRDSDRIPETSHRPVSEPFDPVQSVSEKPANPRRGWWQRLLQS